MGCWNETDLLTSLPILSGDPVVLILLGTVSCAQMYPISFPIRGKYNDYGSIEDVVVDTASQATLKIINDKFTDGSWKFTEEAVERAKGYRMSTELPFKTMEEVIDLIERGYIQMYNPVHSVIPEYPKYTRISFSMLHEKIYQRAISHESRYQRTSTLFNEVDSYRNDLKQESIDRDDTLEHKYKLFSISSNYSSLCRHITDEGQFYFFRYMDLVLGADSEYEEFKRNVNELSSLRSFMYALRKTWAPNPYPGSQSADFKLAADFLHFASNFAQDYEKERYGDEH